MVVLLVLFTVVLSLTLDYAVQRARLRRGAVAAGHAAGLPIPLAQARPASGGPTLAITGLSQLEEVPPGIFLAPGHLWFHVQPDGSVRAGCGRFPTVLLGGADSIEALPAGTVVHKGERLLTLTRGDRSVVLRSPVEGVIDEVNTLACGDPKLLERPAPGEAWVYKLRLRGLAASLHDMVLAEEAKAWLGRESKRLRGFISRLEGRILPSAGGPANLVSVDSLAERLTGEDWEKLERYLFRPAVQPAMSGNR